MGSEKKKILIVEDDADMSFILGNILTAKGFDTQKCDKAEEIYNTYSHYHPDLMLMDRMLDGVDSITAMNRIRKENGSIPIIVLTAMASEEELLKGFENGATDYVKKPFSARELSARIDAHLNLKQPEAALMKNLEIRSIKLNRARMTLDSNSGEHSVTALEYNLAKILIENKNRICPVDMLERELWGDTDATHGQCLRVYISKLRSIFTEDEHIDLKCIRFKGYMLRDLSEDA